MALPQHLKTGYRGEQLAARYLREKGYTVVAANFASSFGETDIIAEAPGDGAILCFVEVKTRSPGALLPPREAVDKDKRRRLENSAAAYMKYKKIRERKYRFDIIEVILHDLTHADINHIENAF